MPNERDESQLNGDLNQQPGKKQPSAADQQSGEPVEGGEIKDKDAETSNSYGHTRDSGERLK